MSKIIDYKTLAAETTGKLSRLVRELIKKGEGWQPYGNQYQIIDKPRLVSFVQPMVKVEQSSDEKMTELLNAFIQ